MGLMDSFLGPGLFIKLGLDKQGFDEGMGKVKVDLTQWRNQTNDSTRDMAKWGAAIGATVAPVLAVGAAIYGLTEKYGDMAQQLRDLSYATGLSTQKLQEFQWAATMSGTNFDRVAFSIGQLNLKIEEATDKSSAAYKAFYNLGVNPEGKSPAEVFEEVAIALTKIEDPAQRASLANELLGKSWRDMLPFMQEYLEKKDKIREQVTFTDEDLESFNQMKSELDSLVKTVEIDIGKIFVAVKNRPHLGLFENEELIELPAQLSDIGNAAAGMVPPVESGTKSLKEIGDEAEKTKRKLEDLAQSIIDTQLSIQGTGMEQRDLGAQFTTLTEEKRINELKISAQPDSSEARDLRARNKEIEKDLERIGLQMNINNQTLIKGTTSIQRDMADLAGTAIETDTKILDSLQNRVEVTGTQYDALNQLDLEHWTTQAGLAQVTYQYIMDSAAEAINFAGSHPIIQKIVQLSASGYDIDPSALTTVTAPVLRAPDFSSVTSKTPKTSEGKESETESGTGTGAKGSGGNTTITLNQTNYGVPDTGYATNKALGRLAQQQGASGL